MKQRIEITNKIYDINERLTQDNDFSDMNEISSNQLLTFELLPSSNRTIQLNNATSVSIIAKNETETEYSTMLVKYNQSDLITLCNGSLFSTQNVNGISDIYIENQDTEKSIVVTLMATKNE